MGRKIPGKKHRGIKDPHQQRIKRLNELKIRTNDPPKNTDDQDIPKSLQRVIKLKNDVKNRSGIQKPKKKKKSSKLISVGGEQNTKLPYSKAKPDKAVPVFNQKPNESIHCFWNRVNRETHDFIKETEFESKYNVDVKRNIKTGKIEGIEKKPKSNESELEKLKSNHKNINKKKKGTEDNIKLTKYQKRKQKLLKKKQKRNVDNIDRFDLYKDKIEFGETVDAPPELKVLPRNTDKCVGQVRYKSLLLNSILGEEKSSHRENTNILNKTGKRKNLPIGERRQLEKQQQDVVAAYRLLKARKFGESTISS